MEQFLRDLDDIFMSGRNQVNESSILNAEDSDVDSVIMQANELLIHKGNPNYKNIEKVRAHGYLVFPGEKDGFGWLTGCIQKHNRLLVFG